MHAVKDISRKKKYLYTLADLDQNSHFYILCFMVTAFSEAYIQHSQLAFYIKTTLPVNPFVFN